jgi:CDP-diacylglycerol---glycerol-3-phosphate 3-phosphatidyltransferase
MPTRGLRHQTHRHFRISRGGKLKTLVQAVAIGLVVLPISGWWAVAASVVMAIAVVLTVVTGVDYVASAARDVRGRSAAH